MYHSLNATGTTLAGYQRQDTTTTTPTNATTPIPKIIEDKGTGAGALLPHYTHTSSILISCHQLDAIKPLPKRVHRASLQLI
jgi:hypothetical protein